MNSNVEIAVQCTPLTTVHAEQCEAIGRSLPIWFGIEDGLIELRHCAETSPGLIATIDGDLVGFITIAMPFPETWEITWMAVAPDHHRQGIGRAMIEAVSAQARTAGARLVHVKTLADEHPSPEYAGTRAFYQAVGFDRLIVLPELWGPENPCLFMVRTL